MARKKTIVESDIKDSELEETNISESVEKNTEDKPVNQRIVPYGITRPTDILLNFEIAKGVEKTFNVQKKYFIVLDNGIVVDELADGDEKIQQYLDYNKQELENNILELKSVVNEPNTLIFFNVGKQDRKYLSYDAYFSQNGLGPRPCLINNWMDFYKSQNSGFTEEEIALKAKGNLKYSFRVEVK